MNQDAFGQGPASGDFAPRRVLVVEDDHDRSRTFRLRLVGG